MQTNAKRMSLSDIEHLISLLQQSDYKTFGPTLKDNAIVYGKIQTIADMPVGYIDEQKGGHYRLIKTEQPSLFAYVVGPDSWKRFLFPKKETLFKAEFTDNGLVFREPYKKIDKQAFIGIRPCELAAINVQDNVFTKSDFKDANYEKRRQQTFFIAVNCTRSGNTCFCHTLQTGPHVSTGHQPFDLSLTEVIDDTQHFFLVESGSEAGESLLISLSLCDASEEDLKKAQQLSAQAKKQQKTLNPKNLKAQITEQLTNQAFWQDIETRCLSCGNCTMVCPTCFCSTVEDTTDLSGKTAIREKTWDSCFNASHSYVAGAVVHDSTASRYRQWFYHKLAGWQDQFNELGCIGCGRCITWCPVGIDITEEVTRLQKISAEVKDNE